MLRPFIIPSKISQIMVRYFHKKNFQIILSKSCNFPNFFLYSVHSSESTLLAGSSSTLVASEREDASGDRVLSFALDTAPYHRDRVLSANEMLNSSSLEPKVTRKAS